MIKIINRSIISIFVVVILSIIYLSIFGINTDKFNNQIKNQIVKFDPRLNLNLKNIRILLKPFDFKINLKTLGSTLILEKKK